MTTKGLHWQENRRFPARLDRVVDRERRSNAKTRLISSDCNQSVFKDLRLHITREQHSVNNIIKHINDPIKDGENKPVDWKWMNQCSFSPPEELNVSIPWLLLGVFSFYYFFFFIIIKSVFLYISKSEIKTWVGWLLIIVCYFRAKINQVKMFIRDIKKWPLKY